MGDEGKGSGRRTKGSSRHRAEQVKGATSDIERQLQLYQAIVSNSPIGIAVLRKPDLVYELVNPALQAMAPGKPLLGNSFCDLFPEIAEVVNPLIEEILGSGQPYSATDAPFRLRRTPEGPLELVYVTFTYVPLRDPTRGYDSLLVLIQETTEQVREKKQNEALAQVSTDLSAGKSFEQIMRTALTSATELLGGEDGSLFLLEDSGHHLRGVLELTAIGRKGIVKELDELPNSKRAIDTLEPIYFTLPEAKGFEPDWFKRLGIWGIIAAPLVVDHHCIGLLYVSFRHEGYSPSKDDLAFAGGIAARCALAIDRARAHEERAQLLAESQRRTAELDATFSSMPIGVIIFASDGAILRINKMAEDMLGYTQEQWSKPLEERLRMLSFETAGRKPLLPEETVTARVLRGERVQGETIIVHRRDGTTTWINVSGSPIVGADGTIFGAVMAGVDITPLHQLQEEQSELVRTISHDLRNPLTPIMGQATLLQRLLANRGLDKEADSVEAIVKNARRMNSMIQDLVDSVRFEAAVFELHREPTDLCSLITDLSERVGAVEERSRLKIECPAWLPSVSADRERIERAITNLITNALKYSPPDRPVVVRVEQRDEEAIISVTDQGVGIPREDQPHLFERFHRTEAGKKRGGLGLGLYITRQIVEAHRGRIWVESKPGKGSTFSFSLPIE